MHKRDYELIADALQAVKPDQRRQKIGFVMWVKIVIQISKALERDNPRFDALKFEDRCDFPSAVDTLNEISRHLDNEGKLKGNYKTMRLKKVEKVYVHGSSGKLVVRADSGEVLPDESDYWDDEYKEIERFDLDEWKRAYPGTEPDHIDVLDLGFWTKDGKYTGPEEDWREPEIIDLLKRIAPVLNKAIEEGAFKNIVAPNAPKKLLKQVHNLANKLEQGGLK